MLRDSGAEPLQLRRTYFNPTMMVPFAFPVEVRLEIYSHLLVHPRPINLENWGYPLPGWRWRVGATPDLCPAFLRTSKQVYNEAVAVLYSHNCFRSLEILEAKPGYPTSTNLTFFLRQIGHLAILLRQVRIEFLNRSAFLGTQLYEDHVHEDYVRVLDLVRGGCVGITTLELSLPFTSGFPVSAASLDLIDTRLKALPALQRVIVDVRWYGGELEEASNGEARDDEAGDLGGVDHWDHPDGCLAAMLRERGWTVQITKFPPATEFWTDPHDMIKSDNGDDYSDYVKHCMKAVSDISRSRGRDPNIGIRGDQQGTYDMSYANDGGPPWYTTRPLLPM